MINCFLLMATWSADGAYCIVLDEANHIVNPLKQYSIDEIHALQATASIKVVISTAQAGIHTLDLPWLGERKAREAIPFALEEQLSQPVGSLHMAFSKAFYQQGHYLVIVVDKQRCADWISTLQAHNISFDCMLLDWFALNPQEVLITDSGALVYADDFKGELGASLAQKYLDKNPQLAGVRCRDSHLDLHLPQEVTVKERVYEWLAKRLNKANSINLCQGELSVGLHSAEQNRWLMWLGGLFLAWGLSILVMNSLYWWELHRSTVAVNAQISTLYQRFFPQETQVVNPRFRIEQLLKTNASSQQRVFWFLLNSFAKVIQQNSTITVEQLNFQDHKLVARLRCADFSGLEQLENALKHAEMQVLQLSAESSDHAVRAVLELRE